METTITTLIIRRRRISLEKDFYNKRIDDLFYAQMLCLAEPAPNEDIYKFKLYLSKNEFLKSRSVFYALASLEGNKAPKMALKRKLDTLKELGLIAEEDVMVDGKAVPAYTFPFCPEGRYYLVEKKMLQYLVDTRNSFAIQIYVYLANAAKLHPNKDYVFTYRELTVALGYSETNKALYPVIKNVLESLMREGVIIWEVYNDTAAIEAKIIPTKRMKLKNIITNYSDLPKIKTKEKEKGFVF